MSFVHLHTHTEYSLLDGAAKIKPLIARAKELEMPALAITDHGYMFGAIDFYQQATAAGIKPLIGCEVYFTPNSRLVKDPNDRTLYHLVLLARTNEGYQNLMKICSHAGTEGFYYRPRVDAEILERYSAGITATSACMFGAVSHFIEQGDPAEARKWAEYYSGVFGPDNFYLEIQNHGSSTRNGVTQKQLCDGIASLAQEMGLGLVATNDIHYVNEGDDTKQDYLMTINSGGKLTDVDRMKAYKELHMKSREEMEASVGPYPGAYDNTLAIAEACTVDLDFDQVILPVIEIPEGKTEHEHLRELCIEGLKKRYGTDNLSKESLDRLDFELSIVAEKGFCGYFLIVSDFTRWALSRGIAVGPGRGSAAGSIIAYSLDITDLDPLEHDLLFERFLNPERSEMPDIDMDFEPRRRDEVINYVREKYGAERVTQVITYNKLMAKAAVRDIARIMDKPIALGTKINAQIPMFTSLNDNLHGNPDKKIRPNPKFQELYKRDSEVQIVTDAAMSIEGYIRGEGVHPCAVIISREDITEYSPVKIDTKAKDDSLVITQYDGETLADMGLLKMDFLGLRNLSVIEDAIKAIEKTYETTIDKNRIPLDDPETFALLTRAHTAGVFQVESSGMRTLLRKMKPTQFADIVAVLALFRPGPLGSGMVDDFVERKHGKRKVTYYDERLKPILEDTYGAIVYQEQVMQISMEMCGFSAAEADKLRKAMGKKILKVLTPMREQWVSGARERGYDATMASQLWEDILPFAEYAFNKSHSAAYGLTTMRTAYLKAHYPGETMAAVLTSKMGKTDELTRYIQECKDEGLAVLPPDINKSDVYFFNVPEEGIRYGLAGIKGVGEAVVESILATREEGGPFKDLYDFVDRVESKVSNKRVVEALIKGGAFDLTGYPRKQLFRIIEEGLLKSVSQRNAVRDTGQMSMFDVFDQEEVGIEDTSIELPGTEADEWDKGLKLAFERDALGIYLSDHPLSDYVEAMREHAELSITSEIPRGYSGWFAGMLTGVEIRVSGKGNMYARGQLEDLSGSLNFIAFGDTLRKHESLFANDKIVLMSGHYKVEEGVPNLTVNRIKELPGGSSGSSYKPKLVVKVTPEQMGNRSSVDDFRRTLTQFPGQSLVELHVFEPVSSTTTVAVLPEQVNVDNQQLQDRLKTLLGEGTVFIE